MSQVYIQVIEDVMNKVREEFINNGGPGEEVLKELSTVSLFDFSHSYFLFDFVVRFFFFINY